jgi:hypothetical protein
MIRFFLITIIIGLFLYLFKIENLSAIYNDEAERWNSSNEAEIIIIDKLITDSIKPNPIITRDKPSGYKKLEITLKSCMVSSKNKKQNAALIKINETSSRNENKNKLDNMQPPIIKKIFYGWIFSDNKTVSHLDHPIYQIYLSKCLN